jgi:hypothetical protein
VAFQEHWHTHIHFLTHSLTHPPIHTPNHTLYLYASESPLASVCNIVDTLCVSLDGQTYAFVACLHRVLIWCSHALLHVYTACLHVYTACLHVYTACHVEYSVCLLEGTKSFLVCACMCEHACTYIYRNPVHKLWVPDKWIWDAGPCRQTVWPCSNAASVFACSNMNEYSFLLTINLGGHPGRNH